MRNTKLRKTFTLTEILVAVAILGIISGIVFHVMNTSKKKLHARELQAIADSERNNIVKVVKKDLRNAFQDPRTDSFSFEHFTINTPENTEPCVKMLEFKLNDGSTVKYSMDMSVVKNFQGKELYNLIREHNGITSILGRNVFFFNVHRSAGFTRKKVQGEIKIWVPNPLGIKDFQKGTHKMWQQPFMKSSERFFEGILSEKKY